MTPQSAIAHYRIISKLGEGGMGAVYRATDTKLNREVAIKVLPDAFASDPDRLARFTREAQVLAALNHPNIAAIYGVEERAIVMELVEGDDLKGPLSADEALPIIEQLIDALEYAHEKGVVHRDLKPANLKLTPDRRLKVLDFGLAKALSSDPAPNSNLASSPTLTMRATMAGVIMGTASYMSPEQARGNNVDKRADIWSFGVVVYELLTGKPLFDGGTVSDTLAAVLRQDLDLTAVPPRFQRVLAKCLTRDPLKRLRDISGARLLLEEEPPLPLPVVQTRRARWPYIALGVVTLIAGIGWWRATRTVERPMLRLSVDLGPEAFAAPRTIFILSPDSRYIVFTARPPEGRELLATRQLDQSKVNLLRGTEGASDPFFSPDGEWVGFFADGKLKKIAVHGGAPVTLCDTGTNARGGSWSADGSIIFAASPVSGLSRIAGSGGAVESLTDPTKNGQATHRWPQVLPDGRAVIFTGNTTSTRFNDAEIDALDLKSGKLKTVQRGAYFGRYLPSGHLVYVHDGVLFAIRFDPGKVETSGGATPLLDDVAANFVSATGRFDFSPGVAASGLFGYVSGQSTGVPAKPVWIDRSGNTQPAVHNGAISPDGRLVAFRAGAIGTINVWDITRDVNVAISSSGDAQRPVWAPDSRHLVFTSIVNTGTMTIWWARSDGGGEPRRLWESPELPAPFSISPDGRRLAYARLTTGAGLSLWTLPLDLSDPENPKAGTPEAFLQSQVGQRDPAFSPDGHWIAYSSQESGPFEIHVRPFPGPGGHWQISSGGGESISPRWSRTGRQLFFVTLDGRIMVTDYEVRGDTFLAGKPRLWNNARVSANIGFPEFDLTPDAARVLADMSPTDTQPGNATVHITLLLNFFDELKRRLP